MSPVVYKAMKKGTLKNLHSQVSVPGPSGPSCLYFIFQFYIRKYGRLCFKSSCLCLNKVFYSVRKTDLSKQKWLTYGSAHPLSALNICAFHENPSQSVGDTVQPARNLHKPSDPGGQNYPRTVEHRTPVDPGGHDPRVSR